MAYYPSGCDANIPDHSCGSCGVELARVRRAAFIHKNYYPTLAADPEDVTLWNTGIAAGSIIILPETQGEYDGGAPQMGQGYGDSEETLNAYLFTAMVKDPSYVGNRDFWNSIKGSRNFHFAFASETIIRLTDVPVTIVPTNPIANDLKAEVVWDCQVKWTSDNFPDEYSTPDVFTCIQI